MAGKEIKLEDIFNDEKREGVKKVIQQHKILNTQFFLFRLNSLITNVNKKIRFLNVKFIQFSYSIIKKRYSNFFNNIPKLD